MEFVKKYIKIIGVVVFVIIMLAVFLNGYLTNRKLENDKMYTVATVLRISVNSSIGESVHYIYSVNDSIFYASDNFYVNEYGFTLQNIIKTRIVVKYQKSDPQNSKLLPNIRIGDKVKAPNGGWASIPVQEDKRCVLE
ncbi:MAG: hypothetical protein KAG84_06400 [Bacteroidales bacterium]|nr:hypothetical protein [Bacteroidales bacterium]